MDLEDGLRKELIAFAQIMGFKIPSNKNLHETLMDFYTVKRKIIEIKPRQVLINPDFKPIIPNHPQHLEIMAIISSAAAGNNLNLFQSKRLIQTNFHDHLLYEWQIYHFHLSLEKDKKTNFVKQVDNLLFAFINERNAIFLGIDKHKLGIFGDEKWVEVLHDHFPQVIKEFRDDSIIDISPAVNSVERQSLWDSGLTLGMTKVRGVVYHNPGIGRMTSGHSIKTVMIADEIIRWVYQIEYQIKKNFGFICKHLNLSNEPVEFKIVIGETTFELIEVNTQIRVLCFPQIFNISSIT